MKRVIFNADDLGICEATNTAILRAHREGVLTSASLMANGAALTHAIETVIQPAPELGIGLHLCLTSGFCVGPAVEIPLLVDEQGRFKRGFGSLLKLVWGGGKEALRQIRRELGAQFEKLADAGVEIDHVNGHRHFHMIPPIFEIVAELAQERGRVAIRISDEPLPPTADWFSPTKAATLARNMPKRVILSGFSGRCRKTTGSLPSTAQTFGVMGSGCMYGKTLWEILPQLADGCVEILTHPGLENPDIPAGIDAGDIGFLKSPDRWRELQALTDPEFRKRIESDQITLARFSDLVAENSPAATVIEPAARQA